MDTGLRVVAVLTLDLAVTLASSTLLWETSGGRSVADAPLLVLVLIVVATAAALSVRRLLVKRSSTCSTTPTTLAIERYAAMGHGTVIIGASAAWAVTPDYRPGWSLTHAAVQVLTATALQLMLDVFTHRAPSPAAGRGTSRLLRERFWSVEVVRVLVVVSAIGALVVTRAVHGWDPGVLDLGIVSTAIAAGLLLGSRLVRPTRRSRAAEAVDP